MPNFHGLSAFIVMSSVAARFFEPQVSGIGAAAGMAARYSASTTTNSSTRPLTCNTSRGRTDRGSASTGATTAAWSPGRCPARAAIAPTGRTGPTPSWTYPGSRPTSSSRRGCTAAACHATPTTSISPTGLCPASEYGSKYVSIPAAGTENDDHNPPRIASRSLFDLSIGDDNLFHGEKHKWSLRLSVVNLTNKEALYNFLSTFSGTHYVTPRAVTATIGFHF